MHDSAANASGGAASEPSSSAYEQQQHVLPMPSAHISGKNHSTCLMLDALHNNCSQDCITIEEVQQQAHLQSLSVQDPPSLNCINQREKQPAIQDVTIYGATDVDIDEKTKTTWVEIPVCCLFLLIQNTIKQIIKPIKKIL